MVKVCEPCATFIPCAQANPELLPIASSKHDNAPIFLTQIFIDLEIRDLPQQGGEPFGAVYSQNAILIRKRHKPGRMPKSDVCAHPNPPIAKCVQSEMDQTSPP